MCALKYRYNEPSFPIGFRVAAAIISINQRKRITAVNVNNNGGLHVGKQEAKL